MRSCSAATRSASPWIAPIAQMRRGRRSLMNLSRPSDSVGGAADAESGGGAAGVIGPPQMAAPSGGVQDLLDAADRRRLVHPVDPGEFTNHPINSSLIDLPVAVGLFRLPCIQKRGGPNVVHRL